MADTFTIGGIEVTAKQDANRPFELTYVAFDQDQGAAIYDLIAERIGALGRVGAVHLQPQDDNLSYRITIDPIDAGHRFSHEQLMKMATITYPEITGVLAGLQNDFRTSEALNAWMLQFQQDEALKHAHGVEQHQGRLDTAAEKAVKPYFDAATVYLAGQNIELGEAQRTGLLEAMKTAHKAQRGR